MEDKDVKIDEVSLNDAAPAPETTPDVAVADDAAAPDAAPAGDDALVDQVRELNDKYLRVAAELENTRRRASRDCESAARNRAMSVVRNFLPVMDAIESAMAHNPDDAGILAMSRAMSAAFDAAGVVKIESVGQTLNPQFHNAIQVIDAPDAAPNTIVQEMQPGYMFDDTVLRTAMVVVAK